MVLEICTVAMDWDNKIFTFLLTTAANGASSYRISSNLSDIFRLLAVWFSSKYRENLEADPETDNVGKTGQLLSALNSFENTICGRCNNHGQALNCFKALWVIIFGEQQEDF